KSRRGRAVHIRLLFEIGEWFRGIGEQRLIGSARKGTRPLRADQDVVLPYRVAEDGVKFVIYLVSGFGQRNFANNLTFEDTSISPGTEFQFVFGLGLPRPWRRSIGLAIATALSIIEIV